MTIQKVFNTNCLPTAKLNAPKNHLTWPQHQLNCCLPVRLSKNMTKQKLSAYNIGLCGNKMTKLGTEQKDVFETKRNPFSP